MDLCKVNSLKLVDIEKTDATRWKKATVRAAKVYIYIYIYLSYLSVLVLKCFLRDESIDICQLGKGVTNGGCTRQLALQHWLEAVSSLSN